jgi:hypothetical protein
MSDLANNTWNTQLQNGKHDYQNYGDTIITRDTELTGITTKTFQMNSAQSAVALSNYTKANQST